MKTKITKKLAKEIFMGDFSNVDFYELVIGNKGRVNRFYGFRELEETYKESLDLLIVKKDFDGLQYMELVHTPNEDYKRSKGHLQTDVLTLRKVMGGYYLSLDRDNSYHYKKHLQFLFNSETKEIIVNRLLNNLKTKLFHPIPNTR